MAHPIDSSREHEDLISMNPLHLPRGWREIGKLVVYNKIGNQLCDVTWCACKSVGDKLLNVQPLKTITIVNVLVLGGHEKEKRKSSNSLVSEP